MSHAHGLLTFALAWSSACGASSQQAGDGEQDPTSYSTRIQLREEGHGFAVDDSFIT